MTPDGHSEQRREPALELFDRGVAAGDLCSVPCFVDAAEPVSDASARLAARGYAAAPVRDTAGGPLTVFTAAPAAPTDREATAQRETVVADQAIEVGPSDQLRAGDPLPVVLAALGRCPLLPVVEGAPGTVVGVITGRDLDRAVVRLAVLGLVLWLEPQLDRLIALAAGPDWEALLSPDRRRHLGEVRTYLARPGVELARMAALNLDDRLTLVRKLPQLRADLGWSSTGAFRRFAEPVRRMRDALAHGGGMVDAVGSVPDAIEVVLRLRRLDDRVAELLARTSSEPA